MTRTLAPVLAPVVEALELEAATVVTTAELRTLLADAGVRTDAYVAIHRLAEHGWLLPTGVKGVWEFAPAAHGGPIGSGDPFLVLRAQLAARPGLDARVGLESALWRHALADRAPERRHVVAVAAKAESTVALNRAFHVTAFAAHLPPIRVEQLPVQDPATVLVHLADSPTAVRNWGLVLDGLAALVGAAGPDGVRAEAAGRPNATLVRLAYLVEPFDATLASSLGAQDLGTVWFGHRGTLRRKDRRWNVADTVLPRAPAEVAARS